MLIEGPAYDRCTGCSSTVSSFRRIATTKGELTPAIHLQVIDTYHREGFAMLLRAFNEQKYLEQLTGLDKLYEEGEAALEQVDWDESDAESVKSI